MPLSQHIILGVHITDRVHHVDPVQHLLTEYGWVCTKPTRAFARRTACSCWK
ncbi:MAG: hypothetical protein ACYTE1_11520 [Planctomycetota bacterium]